MENYMKIMSLIVVSVLIGSCKKEEALRTMVNARSAIAPVLLKYTEAFEKNDAVKLAAFYDEQATVLQSFIEPIQGRDRIERQFSNLFNQSKFSKVSWTLANAESDGLLAYAHGNFTMTLLPNGLSKAVTISGKFLSVWKKDHTDNWKILSEMRESND